MKNSTGLKSGQLFIFAPIPMPHIPTAGADGNLGAGLAIFALVVAAIGLYGWYLIRESRRSRMIEKAEHDLRLLDPDKIKQQIDAEQDKLTGKESQLAGIVEKTRLLITRARSLEARLYVRTQRKDAPSYMVEAYGHAGRVANRLEQHATALETYRASIIGLFDECRARAKAIDEPVADYMMLKELQGISSEAERIQDEGARVALRTAQALFSQQARITALVNEGIQRSGIEVAVLAADASGDRFNINAMEEAISRLISATPKIA